MSNHFDEIKELLSDLTSAPTVSGHEARLSPVVEKIATRYFDEWKMLPSGSFVLTKRSGVPGATKILLDAHIDEVGMLVKEILEDGFLSVVPVGGIDTRILPASEVMIYGAREVYGVVSATPPHLQNAEARDTLPAISEIRIDTGFSKDELAAIAPPGTPICYRVNYMELLNGRLCGRSFDDKICAAVIILSAVLAGEAGCKADIAVLLSSREEVGHIGAITGAYAEDPDYAIVLDVGSAAGPDNTARHKSYIGKGPEISFSALTDIKFTKKLIAYAKERGIPVQPVAEAGSTGTNANNIPLTRRGVKTALISIPLNNMHTAAEVIALSDAEAAAELVAGFLCRIGDEQKEA